MYYSEQFVHSYIIGASSTTINIWINFKNL